MTFHVEVVLRGRDFAVTETVSIPYDHPGTWDDEAVREVLEQILRAIDRAEHPAAPPDRPVVLRGFSWIVEPAGEGNHGPSDRSPGPSDPGSVVIAIEIPMGAAVAGPFAIGQAALDAMITRVVQRAPSGTRTIH